MHIIEGIIVTEEQLHIDNNGYIYTWRCVDYGHSLANFVCGAILESCVRSFVRTGPVVVSWNETQPQYKESNLP